MKKLKEQDNDSGIWYEDESGAEVFIPNDDENARKAWEQASSLWQKAQGLGVVGRAK